MLKAAVGQLFVRLRANQLIAAGLTDLGGGAAFYALYVRLEKRTSRGRDDFPMSTGGSTLIT